MCNLFSGHFETPESCFVSCFLSVNMADQIPFMALDAVLKQSGALPEGMPQIRGYDFNQGVDHRALLHSYLTTGFQASSFAMAVQEINKMVSSKGFLFFYLLVTALFIFSLQTHLWCRTHWALTRTGSKKNITQSNWEQYTKYKK